MIKAFIFDLDGTIVDTEPLFTAAWNVIGDRYNRKYTNEIKRGIIAYKAITAVEHVLKAWDLDQDPAKILSEIDEIYSDLVGKSVELVPGTADLLEILDDLGIRKAVSSSSQKKWVDTIFTKLDLHPQFEQVITADDVEIGKPHPEAFSIVMERLGLQPGECVAVEDAPHGITSAKQAGATTIAIPGEFMPDADLSHADYLLPRLSDITKEFILSLDQKNTRS